jgi:hypothetical protein
LKSYTDAPDPERLVEIHRQQDEAIAAIEPFPAERFTGRGIVMLAGGETYFTCAWVNLTLLRTWLGCDLPVEVWYLGNHEMSPEMLRLLERCDGDLVNARAMRRRFPYSGEGGWPTKPYAIAHSRFREVLYVDADSLLLSDPRPLFDDPAYRETGALFWPDVRWNDPENPIWEICRVPYPDAPESEAGQIVLDKERCWRALALTLHLNEQSHLYYRYLHGDKDTFQLAWRMLGQPFTQIPILPLEIRSEYDPGERYTGNLSASLLQFDRDGHPRFFHRTYPKLCAWGRLPRRTLVHVETICEQALRELRELWDGRVHPRAVVERPVAGEPGTVESGRFEYWRVGADVRVIELLPDGSIRGAGALEQHWRLIVRGHTPTLIIANETGDTCWLMRHSDGVWRGRWLRHERMPVELAPLANAHDGRALVTTGTTADG